MFEQIRRSAQIFVAAIHVGKNGRFMLEPGELLALVESWGWTVKHYREGESAESDHHHATAELITLRE